MLAALEQARSVSELISLKSPLLLLSRCTFLFAFLKHMLVLLGRNDKHLLMSTVHEAMFSYVYVTREKSACMTFIAVRKDEQETADSFYTVYLGSGQAAERV